MIAYILNRSWFKSISTVIGSNQYIQKACFLSKSFSRLFSAFEFNKSAYKVYSRIYGFTRNSSNEIIPVQKEIKIIQRVFLLIANGITPETIKEIFDKESVRQRSGKKFTETEIQNLIRPVYAGQIKTNFGFFVASKVYPSIVERKIWKKAIRNLYLT